MNMKSVLLFGSGLLAGATGGVIGTMKYFQHKYQNEFEALRDEMEAYYRQCDHYARLEEEQDEEGETDDGINSESKPGGRMSSEDRAAIKEKLSRNWEGTTNYAGMYRRGKEDEAKSAEAEHPHDQGEEGEEEPICQNCKNCDLESGYCSLLGETVNMDASCDDFISFSEENGYAQNEEAFEDHQKNKDKAPKIISAEAYSNLPAYIDQEILYFYSYDEILCDENEEPIDEPERLVGDALTKYGFIDNDERIIFVMNYAIDTCYEIQKIDQSYTDTH